MKKFEVCIIETEFRKIILKFYPDKSSVHGFHDIPPRKWEDVYKVYFSYDVVSEEKDTKYKIENEIFFNQTFDECSAIDQVSYLLGLVLSGKNIKSETVMPFGDGTWWKIEYSHKDSLTKESLWTIWMWMNNGRAYRFVLNKNKIKELKECIDSFLSYMLEHSVGI